MPAAMPLQTRGRPTERDIFKPGERCQQAGMVPYLAVLKRHRPDPFLMTHAVDGYSLAMDFAVSRNASRREALWMLCRDMAETVLAAYYSRSPQGAEFEQGAKMFQDVIAKTQRKSMTALYNYATRVLCGKSDRAGYEKVMHEILDAGDVDENRRLTNNIARLKAKRALGLQRMMDCGFDMSQPAK